ncbi:MAG TPA: DEAD/DEAH box helicase [Gemmatirosa sp.]
MTHRDDVTLPPTAVRALLAHAALGLAPHARDAQVGPLALRPHQRHAAARLRYALQHYRVALLADDVGLGKTAVALALARDAADALIIAPAALRAHWTAALDTAGLARTVVSAESLGHANPHLHATPPLVVVDEAHHFRNPRTRRWHALARLAAHGRLLLLTATPVHNRADDLAALFALALGARATALDADTLARLVVRRAASHLRDRLPPRPAHTARADPPLLERPTVAPTTWIDLAAPPTVLDALRTLPVAVAPSDGATAPELDRYTLTRLWASSDAALRAGLRRRLARALAVTDAFDAGRHPTRAELHALTRTLATDASTVQLSLLPPTAPAADATPARAQLATYVAAVRRTITLLRDAPGDACRADHLRALRARYPDAHIVAFSHSTDTVRALYARLAPHGRVAMLTAAGGRIASGSLARADVLARFAPLGQSRPAPAAIERIDLLLTTDVLSEGLDLRDASVVVHLDLPWTPARLAQRTGRAVRPGAPAAIVHVHAFRPPPAIARDLRLAAHARRKRRAANQTVGASPLERALADPSDDVSNTTSGPSSTASSRPTAVGALTRDRFLERWSECLDQALDAAHPMLAVRTSRATVAVRSRVSGYVAVVALPTCLGALRVPTLVASLAARRPTSTASVVRRALAHLAHADAAATPPAEHARAARRALAHWARRRIADRAVTPAHTVFRDAHLEPDPRPDARGALLARTYRALRAAAPTERASLTAAAAALRSALTAPLSADREAALRAAAPPSADDAAWLIAAARLLGPATPARPRPASTPRATLRALVLLVGDDAP